MNGKEFLLIIILFVLLFIGIASINASYGADLDVVRDFDNTTIYHTVKSDSGSQAVYGIENNAALQSRDGKLMKNGIVVSDNGEYNYKYLVDENDNVLSSDDRVKFNVPRNLTAVYDFIPYKSVEIDILDYHGHSGGGVTYPAMKSPGDSVTHVFKPFTDVEEGFYPLYILDLGTNQTFNPGDQVSFTYDDVDLKLLKTYQYVYGKDIVVENIIVENRTVYNDTVVDRVIYNDTIIDRTIYNDTIIDRTIYNDTIVNRTIYNDTIIDRVIYNDIIVNRTIYNDTIVNRTIYNDIIIDRIIENIIVENRTIYNDIVVDRIIENIIIIPKFIIDGIVEPIPDNGNNGGNNQNNNGKVSDNDTSIAYNTTININEENTTSQYISDDPNKVIMKRTDNPIGLLILIILFLILIQFYRR